MNRMRVTKDGRQLGTVTTLRDRTELADLEREIGSFRSTTQLLRAQTHEFANQLHTIRGLIQLGEYDEVVRLRRRGERAPRPARPHRVNSRVRDTAVAGAAHGQGRRSPPSAGSSCASRTTPRSSGSRPRTRPTSRPSSATSSTTPSTRRQRPRATDQWVELTIRQDAARVEVERRRLGARASRPRS